MLFSHGCRSVIGVVQTVQCENGLRLKLRTAAEMSERQAHGCRAVAGPLSDRRQGTQGAGDGGMTAIDFSSFVDQLATASGDTILPFFRTALAIENKKAGGFDPVTAADRAAEQSMRTLIRRQFPNHGILGEEYGSEHTDAEYVWVLDPIDGTKSFISGMLAWGTLIGLMRFGEPVFGLMDQPFTRERFSGDSGAARYRGPTGKRDLHVRDCASIGDALMYTTSPLADAAETIARPSGSWKTK